MRASPTLRDYSTHPRLQGLLVAAIPEHSARDMNAHGIGIDLRCVAARMVRVTRIQTDHDAVGVSW